MSFLSRLYRYQHERFPLRFLIFTTLSSILATGAVVGGNPGTGAYVAAFMVGLLAVFHIRVIDESRDAAYDKEKYPGRPVQVGLVSIGELFVVDLVGILAMISLAWWLGKASLLYTGVFIAFTGLAWRDFFTRGYFVDKPLVYHLVNSPQMIVLQLLVFSLFTGNFSMSLSMWLFMGLFYLQVFLLEIVRKIRPGDESSQAGDLYSRSMGFLPAIRFTVMLVLLAFGVFACLLYRLPGAGLTCGIIGLAILFFFLWSAWRMVRQQSGNEGKIFTLAALLVHVGFNVLLFLSTL